MPNIQEIIESRGGTYIEEYKQGRRKYVTFECENGHEVSKRTDDIKKTWCKECQKNTIEDAYNLAEERGFKFLSDEYKNSTTHYLWECSEGHQWKAKYSNIKTGKGCPECLKIPFEYFVDLITNKEGQIITTQEEYEGVRTKIKYTCKEGHNCESIGSSLKRGVWCLECQMSLCERTCRKIFEYLFNKPFVKSRHLKNPLTNKGIELDGYNKELKIAFEYNGQQHYKRIPYWHKEEKDFEEQQERDNITEKLCQQEEIKLIIIPYTVKYEDLYAYIVKQFPEKDFEKTIDYELLKLESYKQDKLDEIKKVIESLGGLLISDNYINNTTKMAYVCANGHEFKTTWGCIQQGSFCKKCSDNKLSNKALPVIEEFCKKYHFELLSDYTRAKDLLRWRCTKCNEKIEKNLGYFKKDQINHILIAGK